MAFDISTLVSAQVHDIKNELQALQTIQDELAIELSNHPQATETLKKIQSHSHILNQRLIELLSLLKLQNQDFKISEDEHWLMDTLTPIQRHFGTHHDLDIRLNFDDDINGFYDEQLVNIAIHNIATNAVNAGAKTLTITVDDSQPPSWSILTEDDGPGFSQEILDSSEWRPEGTDNGLGLYLIAQCIRAHCRAQQCGNIALANIPGGGAQHKLIFP